MRWTLRSFVVRLLAAALVLVLFVPLVFVGRVSLPQSIDGFLAKSRTYFINSPTAVATERARLTIFDLPFVQGEKVTFSCGKDRQDELVQSLLSRFSCLDIWSEEVGDTISYYASSEILPKKVVLQGRAVNLHIALRGEEVVVGTPIIFGGY